MGGKTSKTAVTPAAPPSASAPSVQQEKVETPTEHFTRIRNELMSHSLGGEAYRYVKRQLAEHPDDPALMALLGDTVALYEKVKNPTLRVHWLDRLALLDEGLAATAKCIKHNPDFAPCYHSYVRCATKAADQEFFFTALKPIGLLRNWHMIHKYAEKSLELEPTVDVAMTMATVNARAARDWWWPYAWAGWVMGLPSKSALLDEAVELHLKAKELDPGNLENVARLGQACYAAERYPEARRWFSYVRDEMVPREPDDVRWASLAHTNLATHFPSGSANVSARGKWTVPLG
eukprot:PhM_4_TR5709/c0_g1_i1/m.94670